MSNRTSVHPSPPSRCLPGAKLFLALAVAAAFPAYAGRDLTMLSLEQLMNLKVVGASKYEQKQSEVAAAVSIITRDDIRAFGWRTLDQALASLPGIHTTYDRQYSSLGARGFGLPGDYNTRVLVTINGNRSNEAVYDSGVTGREFPLDLDLIERIEFIPGPGSAVYGQNAMFGVVNVITRKGAGVDGVELAGAWQNPQAMGEGRASFGKLLDNGTDVLFSVSGMRAKGENHFFNFGAAGVSGVAAGMDGERTQQFFGRVAHGSWAVELVDGYRRKDDPAASYLSDPLVARQYQSDRYTLAQARYEQSFSDNTLQLQARLFAGSERYRSSLSYGTEFSFPSTSEWRGGELRFLYTALAHHKLMVGLDLQDNTRIEQQILDLANSSNDRVIARSVARTGLYVQDEWPIADSLTATLGLRLDRTTTTDTAASPRVGMIWQAAPATTLKALYGRAHRAPSAFERDYSDESSQVENATLKGERIDTLELVTDHRVGTDMNLRGSVYQWTIHDLISLGIDPVTELPQYQSSGTVKAKGVELSAEKTWTSGARVRGSLSLQRARSAQGTVLVNSPQLLGKLGFSLPLPVARLRVGYELQYDSARRTANGTDTRAYSLSNLNLSTDKWVKGLELGLGIRNLFDKRYAHPRADGNWQNAIAQDGRSVRLQATYKF
ncbi:MAG: TonB-dependent receptor [Polaromonas sp. 39-63-203]|uniref:TonB-dependent receptor plug domain-containing protein n=1 Tax=Polaromonas sp. TaxID=1869339 RepID=UPI000BCE1E4C|nr:TonB-dependent receptor [Polaromonas sp.]OYY53845.1 MAG: TonB-dependent receptor [Polaromonas sp. 35-63-240]OYZ84891.1 MAG: TonB-dependent receptor [Polaromonas sp. 24-62-144]OZB02257.1 MAG: TonB-dependent receptor [Polaromonas sp. 39-63-203]HQS30500.1 TonB-dependent receptor [Polaromonas sp.]HQS89778.1 TonB-dependent receptor [Polaromonas sp.]